MTARRNSFLFLSANTPWVYALAEALSTGSSVHAIRFFDWRTYLRHRPSWPSTDETQDIEQTLKVLPTGYAGTLEPLARPYLRYKTRQWQRTLTERSGSRPWVIAPYYYLAPWVTREVPSDRLIYYNLDDYTQYEPHREERILTQEQQLIAHAAYTLCLSRYQVDALKDRHPEEAASIHHFPLGVVEEFINPEVERTPNRKAIGYVGNLTNRVDWYFVDNVVSQMPECEFIFVGSAGHQQDSEDWAIARKRVFGRANVTHTGRVPQDEVKAYYWSFAVNWIPYDADHPFNRASCPTKIMDAMAAGRPIVSTDVPECRLYPQWIDIASTPDEAAGHIRTALRTYGKDQSHQQVEFARKHLWSERAVQLNRMLQHTLQT